MSGETGVSGAPASAAAPDRRLTDLVYIRASRIHGRGCFARRRIPEGAYIGSYAGRPASSNSRYVLWVDQGDGRWEGVLGTNELKFLNHSLQPNAEFDGADLYALREIEPDEEITFHYGEEWEGVE